MAAETGRISSHLAKKARNSESVRSLWAILSIVLLGLSASFSFKAQAHEGIHSETEMTSSLRVPGVILRERRAPPRLIDDLVLSIKQESFLDSSAPRPGPAKFSRISGHLRTRTATSPMTGVLEVGGSFAANAEKETNVEVPEAYLEWAGESQLGDGDDSGRTTLTLGRKLESWSALDSMWSLGIWQPLNRFDLLRPSEQGLTGIFYSFRRSNFEFVGYIGTVFIPEQGAPFDLQNGKFYSNNPWYTPPADTLVIFGRDTEIRYRVEMPQVGAVLNHPSAGFIARYGRASDEGGFAQLAVAKKPRNQLSVPFSGVFVTGETQQAAEVRVYPQVAYHQVGSIDLGYKFGRTTVGLSGLADLSDPEVFEENVTYQKLEPLFMVSPALDFAFDPRQGSRSPRVQVGYLRSFGGAQVASGKFATGGAVFASRTMFREAASLGFRSRLYSASKWKIDGGVKWVEELSEQGSLLMADAYFDILSGWRLGVTMDLLASRRAPEDNSGTIAKFRANDRVGASLSYVF